MQVVESSKLRKILEMVIAMGNFLNEGTKQVSYLPAIYYAIHLTLLHHVLCPICDFLLLLKSDEQLDNPNAAGQRSGDKLPPPF